ncbi:MAG: hypothetical protein IPP78_06805 [Holophagaceae bacterium]|nr:hypothetical protein [Holophagaceae bacterium]
MVAVAESLRQELLTELNTQLVDWHPVEVPVASPRTATIPRLKVRVKKYQPKPAGSPFAAIGVPGLLGLGSGWAVVNSTSLVADTASVSLANVAGFGVATTGLAALVIGITLESRKTYLDRKRGYPMHMFKAEVRIVWPESGGLKEEKESYRSFNLGSEARPMSPADAADPARVRREMMRALAIKIREDMSQKTGWGRPEAD